MDTGGLGKKIAEEMIRRYTLPIKPAQKADKYAHIELVNDGLRTGRFHVKRNSQFAADSMLLEWDMDKSSGDKLVVSDRFHSDICDAVLYGYREVLSFLNVPEPARPAVGSDAWLKAEQEAMESAIIAQLNRNDLDPANWPKPEFD
jgi:hypothetical protein